MRKSAQEVRKRRLIIHKLNTFELNMRTFSDSQPFEELIPWYDSLLDLSVAGDILVRVGSLEVDKPFIRIIHHIITDDAHRLEESLPTSPGFIDFTDMTRDEFVDEKDVDDNKLNLSCEAVAEVDARFKSIGLTEVEGCIRELDGTPVKKMLVIVEDTEDSKTLYILKELTHIYNNDEGHEYLGQRATISENNQGVIGVNSLGNEVRLLRLLHKSDQESEFENNESSIQDVGYQDNEINNRSSNIHGDNGRNEVLEALGNEVRVLRLLHQNDGSTDVAEAAESYDNGVGGDTAHGGDGEGDGSDRNNRELTGGDRARGE